MYSSANNHDTSTSILSIKEIVAIVVVFAFVLYLLFPKNDINSIIENQGKNTNLSINYLQSMLLYYPDSIKLKMILIKNYQRAGKLKEALQLTRELLKKCTKPTLLDALYKQEYLLLKQLYFKTQEPKLLKEAQAKLSAYFEWTKPPRDYMFFFPEAVQIDSPKLQFVTLKGLMRQRPELIDYKFEKELFSLATLLGEDKQTKASLQALLSYPEAESSIKEYAISYFYAHEEYAQAQKIAQDLFIDAQSPEEIRNYFSILLNLLSQTKSLNEKSIIKLLHAYKQRLPLAGHDIQRILEQFLASGEIHAAAEFAKKSFLAYKESFDPALSELAIKSLTYDQQLKPALKIALFAHQKFKQQKWLDQAIKLALWQGEIQKVVNLNILGYHHYPDPKYEHYLLHQTDLNHAYAILGEIYQKHLQEGDYRMVEKVASYFEYTGAIPQGEAYFRTMLKQHPIKEIHQQAILFAHYNRDLQVGVDLYREYKKNYGIDPKLQQHAIEMLTALKRHNEAYRYAKELNKATKKLIDMAWIAKDYPYLYTQLWQQERENQLFLYGYNQLITLERALNHGKQLTYLYRRAWEKSHEKSYLYALLYRLLMKKDYTTIEAIRKTVPNPKRLKNDAHYQIFLANYYTQTHQSKLALKAFKQALYLEPNKAQTHQAYLWFLITQTFTKELKEELYLLETHPKLQSLVGFPSVIAALELKKGDLALRWLKPLINQEPKPAYLTIYADLIEQQDQANHANKIRMQLFQTMQQRIKKEPKLLLDKGFVRLYLPLFFRYARPVEQSKPMLKRFKEILGEALYQELKLGYHTYHHNLDQLYYLADQEQIDQPWLQLYLAMGYDNNTQKAQLLAQHLDRLPIRDRVIASIDIGDHAGAYTLAFKGLQENQNDSELYRIFAGMINQEYPSTQLGSSYEELSPKLSLQEQHLTQRWRLYRDLKLSLSLHNYHYTHEDDTALSVTLNGKEGDLEWRAKIANHQARHPFAEQQLQARYRLKDLSVTLGGKHHSKTTQSPKLQTLGMQDSLYFQLTQNLSPRLRWTWEGDFSNYQLQDDTQIGSSRQNQWSLSYLLHSGYPDLRITGYLFEHDYRHERESFLPHDFMELGGMIAVGKERKDQLQRGWRPFGSVALSINDQQKWGGSLSLGLSGAVRGGDNLELYLDYSKGIDMVSHPSYGAHLEYRF